ncbi:MAG: oligosaccharide flippase family protein [bacterium]
MGNLANRTIKNSVYSFSGFVWMLLLSFIAMPIVIKGLGSEKYGFFVLLNSILSVFGLLDLGMGYPFFKKLSENPENPDYKALTPIFSLTFWFYTAVGLFCLLILLLIRGFLPNILNSADGFVYSYTWMFLMVGLTFFLKMIAMPLQQMLPALQRIDLSTKISLINITLIQIGSIVVVSMGYGITSLVLIQLSSAFLLFSIYFILWKKLLPGIKLKLYFSFKRFRSMLKDGFMVFISNFMSNILAQFDKFVLSFFWGPSSVSYYSSGQMITDKIHSTSFSLSTVFTPVFSNIDHLKQGDRQIKIFRRAIRFISFITFGLTITIFLYGNSFIKYWINEDFAINTVFALKILAFTYFMLSLFGFIYAFLIGIKRLKFVVFATTLNALLNVTFIFILIPRFSLNGAAVAYLLSTIPVFYYLYYIEHNIFQIKKKMVIFRFYSVLLLKLFTAGAITYIISSTVLFAYANALWKVVLIGGFTLGLYFVIFYICRFFDKEDWNLLKDYFFTRFKNKLLKN